MYILCLDDCNNHRGIPVIPFAKYERIVGAYKKGYPHTPTTIGEFIRKRRMDLNLLQKDVAAQFGTTECTITNWEMGRGEPQLHYFPKLIAFLGFMPIQIDTSTLGGKIKHYRFLNGMSHKKMGTLIGVDPATISSWETHQNKPLEKSLKILMSYLNQIEQTKETKL